MSEYQRLTNNVFELVRNDPTLSAVIHVNNINSELDVYASIHDERTGTALNVYNGEDISQLNLDQARKKRADQLRKEIKELEQHIGGLNN